MADDWGAHASAYGTRWIKTPAFDRVAREGLLFTRACTPMAKCAPSRVHHHGTQHLTDRGGGESHLLFSREVQRLERGARGARVVRRAHDEGLGAGHRERCERQAAAAHRRGV
ncbi:MAG: hypothetical protein WCK55_03925 [Verrucomicrobiota bacterium]